MTQRKLHPEPGSEEELVGLLRRAHPALDAIRRAYGIDAESGRDLLQTSLIRFFERRVPVESPVAWLKTAFRHECLHFLRKRRLEAHSAQELAQIEQARRQVRSTSGEIRVGEVLAAVDRLDARARRLVRGLYLEETAPEELARELGVARSSLKKMAARVRARVRKLLRAGRDESGPPPR